MLTGDHGCKYNCVETKTRNDRGGNSGLLIFPHQRLSTKREPRLTDTASTILEPMLAGSLHIDFGPPWEL